MQKIRYLSLVILSACLLVLSSCEYDIVKPDTGDIPANVSFTDHIIPVFNSSCNMSGCHAAGNVPPDLSPANAYDALISGGFINKSKPESSILYISMSSGSMKPFSKPGETALILAWIQQGAKNN
ncbi:MAG: hypothetical protein AB9842_02700 [Bacteroidales bacterium]